MLQFKLIITTNVIDKKIVTVKTAKNFHKECISFFPKNTKFFRQTFVEKFYFGNSSTIKEDTLCYVMLKCKFNKAEAIKKISTSH